MQACRPDRTPLDRPVCVNLMHLREFHGHVSSNSSRSGGPVGLCGRRMGRRRARGPCAVVALPSREFRSGGGGGRAGGGGGGAGGGGGGPRGRPPPPPPR